MVAKIAFADARAVEETAQQLDLDALHLVIDALVAAPRVDIYGVAASGSVALDFQQKLHRIGRVAFAWTDPHIALTSAALLTPGDVAVAISHSGATQDTIDALALAQTQRRHHRRVDQLPALAARRSSATTCSPPRPARRRSAPAPPPAGSPSSPSSTASSSASPSERSTPRQRALELTHDAVLDRRVGRKSGR